MKRLVMIALLLVLVTPARALDVRDIIDNGASIPVCLNIADAYEVRRIRALTQDGFARPTLYGRAHLNAFVDDARTRLPDGTIMPSCQWLRAGATRYVAEKHRTDARSPGAYFCLGLLKEGTNVPDKSQPCQWAYMADMPTSRQPRPAPTYPPLIDPLNPPSQFD